MCIKYIVIFNIQNNIKFCSVVLYIPREFLAYNKNPQYDRYNYESLRMLGSICFVRLKIYSIHERYLKRTSKMIRHWSRARARNRDFIRLAPAV